MKTCTDYCNLIYLFFKNQLHLDKIKHLVPPNTKILVYFKSQKDQCQVENNLESIEDILIRTMMIIKEFDKVKAKKF